MECVADGAAALERILSQSPDLLVLDLGLPIMDGMDLLRAAREISQELAIVVLTGRSQMSYRIDCLNFGADDYLVKPFSLQELLARCRAVRRRSGDAQTNVLRHGSLRMDRMARRVTLGTESIDFTGREFVLLEYLLLQRGRAVSRQELLREVWRMAPDAGTNVVDVYVNYLRRKLSAAGDAGNLIETMRGEGYAIGMAAVPAKIPARVLPALPDFRQFGAA